MEIISNGILSDEDDPIVEEMPIYLSKRLSKQLFVFQYPLRPEGNTDMTIQKSYFKPHHKEVKLEVSIDTNSANFDSLRAEDMARLVDQSEKESKDKKKIKLFKNNIVDKITYTSTKVVQDTSIYAIGAYNDFIDKCVKHKKKEQIDENDDEDAGTSNAQAVTVKFARNDGDKHLKAKELTYKQLKEKSDSEKWLDCLWFHANAADCDLLKEKLFAEHLEDNGQTSTITNLEYIKLLVPEDQEQAVIKPSLPSHVVSLHALRSLPVQEQCRLLMKDTKMIQFQQLMLLLASGKGITQDAVMKSLPHVAVLVRGNWVAKSEILYPQNSFSAISGVSAEQMCKARDYVLYLFTKQDFVERRKVSHMIRLPAEEVKEIFTGISKLKHNRGWELLLPEDVEFMAKHADIVERQKRLWEHRWQQLNEFYKDCPKVERKRKKSKSIGGEQEVRIKKESISDDADSGTEKKSPIVAKKNHKKKVVHDVPIKTEIEF